MKIRRYTPNPLTLFRIAVLCFTFFALTAIAIAIANAGGSNQPDNNSGVTVGMIMIDPPEKYVITENPTTKIKRLYKAGEIGKLKGKRLKALKTVELDTIEYRYNRVAKKVKFISDEFYLIELKGKKAVLIKDHAEPTPAIKPKREPLDENAPQVYEVPIPLEEETPEKNPLGSKRLISSYFLNIESKNLSDHEWEIRLPTILEALANFGAVLGAVVEKTDKLIEPEKDLELHIKCALGKAVLNKDGLLVKAMSSRIKAKCGIKSGDLIKSVNSRSLSSIRDIAAVFATFSGSAQTVTLRLIRKDEELIYIYYIK